MTNRRYKGYYSAPPPPPPDEAQFDGLGTLAPRVDGTAFSFGHREDTRMIGRLLRQCREDMGGYSYEAIHTTKRLLEQLTGSIKPADGDRLAAIPYDGNAWDRRKPQWLIDDENRRGMVDWPTF